VIGKCKQAKFNENWTNLISAGRFAIENEMTPEEWLGEKSPLRA
jgi:hypothetical protein